MAVTRAFWTGMGVAFPPSLLLLAAALWYAHDWWLVGIVWLLCTCVLIELADGAPSAESLGIPDDDEEDSRRH